MKYMRDDVEQQPDVIVEKHHIHPNRNESSSFPKPSVYDEFTIFGASYCGYCTKAKELLEEHNIQYVYHDISDMNKLALVEYTKQKTIPMIFQRTKFIGGYTELKKILES